MELAKALAADNLDKYEAFCSVGNEAEVHVASSVPAGEAVINTFILTIILYFVSLFEQR